MDPENARKAKLNILWHTYAVHSEVRPLAEAVMALQPKRKQASVY